MNGYIYIYIYLLSSNELIILLRNHVQLSELVRVDGYLEWVELAADFTVKSLKEWQWSTNSIHYLLALWGRLVAAVPYVRADTGAKSHTETLQVCFRVCGSRLGLAVGCCC